jgi:arabinofuranosyltransferase
LAPAIAILLYLLYIINIGGCFMAGRYLAAPLLVAVVLLSQIRNIPKTLLGFWVILILVAGLTPNDSPIYAKSSDKGEPSKIQYGVVRERDWYNPTHGLMNYRPSQKEWPTHDWIETGKSVRAMGQTYFPHVAVGMVGFYAGPQAFVLDVYAITDPLLARLPVNEYVTYRIGHFGRMVPAGYKRSILTGENHINDRYLAEYYARLALLTRGDIFDLTRLWEIAKFNIGWYDHLVKQYLSPHLIKVNLEDISEPRKEGIIGVFANNFVFHQKGLEIDLGRVRRAAEFELSRDHNNGQRVQFILAGEEIAAGIIPAAPIPPGGLSTIVVSVPPEAIERGYDKIRIIPTGEGFNSIGHLRLLDQSNN